MAIDQDIQQRVDAYRNNPQALQQRYAANQQLLDLLALQRLKSEKDDAARKVQMEMQQNPQTIKQQREQQLLDMTKQDLAQQTAGIMQNKQQQQQKNMQRVAKQGAAPPQQVQQLQSGLGALARRQQQQAPRRMAAGGIVAFAKGGEITQADIDAYRRGGGQARRNRAKLTDEQIRAILERAQGPDTSGYEMVQTRRGLRRKPMALDTAAEQAPQIETAVLEEKDAAPVVEEVEEVAEVAEEVVTEARDPNAATFETPPSPPEAGGLAAMLKENTLTTPSVDLSKVGEGGKGILSAAGIGAQDPTAAMKSARSDAASYLGRDKKAQTMQEYLEQIKALDVSQTDPKKMRDEQISAFLRGTAGGGSFGTTMAGGSGAMAAEREKQEKSQRDRLLSRLNIEKSAMDMDLDIAKQAQSSGDNAYSQAMANQRTIANVMATTRGQDIDLAMKQADMEYRTNKDNVQNILKGLELEYNEALRRDIAEGDRAARAGQILGDLQTDRAQFFQDALAADPTYRNAQIAANQENPPPNADELVRAAYNAVQLRVTKMYEDAGLLDTESRLLNILEGGGGTMPTSPTMPGSFALSGEGQSALERNLPK